MKKYLILFFIFKNSFAFIPGYYQPGVQGIRDIEMPQKGWGIYWYNSFYNSHEFNDSNGDEVNPKDYGVVVDTELNAYTTFSYFFWMPGVKILGGNYGFSLNFVLGSLDLFKPTLARSCSDLLPKKTEGIISLPNSNKAA